MRFVTPMMMRVYCQECAVVKDIQIIKASSLLEGAQSILVSCESIRDDTGRLKAGSRGTQEV